jgi:hypothetical protein
MRIKIFKNILIISWGMGRVGRLKKEVGETGGKNKFVV